MRLSAAAALQLKSDSLARLIMAGAARANARAGGFFGVGGPVFLLGVFAPAFVALALTAHREGRASVARLLARIGRWQVDARLEVGMSRIAGILLGALLSPGPPLAAQTASSLEDDLRVRRPAYASAGPLVLFDAAHANVHTSTGRYERFASLMRADGYRVEPNTLPLDRGQLQAGAVLVIVSALGANRDSTPDLSGRPAFTSREVDSVEVWVRRGGSLLLIVDHEPTGIANATLAARFGIQLADGWVEDPDSTHHWSGCRGCLRFTRATGLLGDHPVMEGRDSTEQVRGVVSAVGQSLGSVSGATALLRLGPDAVDIHAGGDTTSARGRSQGVALAFGAGRVVVLGEAAMLAGMAAPRPDSPFRRWWSQEPGIHNRQFALNILHWLSRVLPMGSAPP